MKIISIETSTNLCSLAVFDENGVLAYRESNKESLQGKEREHSKLTALFVKEILDELSLSVKDCDAVSVCSGPGSYTGLRVGASTAKGLCFGANLPLISVNTLELLFLQAKIENLLPENCKYIIPLVDARRDEVYTCVYDMNAACLQGCCSKIIDLHSFEKELSEGKCLFIGDGAGKCKSLIGSNNSNAYFFECFPKASAMRIRACQKFKDKEFEDIAYFEPNYLKEYIVLASKKNVLK